ncbi:MAG: TlpA disulfide reductase family protein [Longimicrobiales bacterium]|nr:TlpA disulfide reductase family protein [Longimicrobiales bacterium]
MEDAVQSQPQPPSGPSRRPYIFALLFVAGVVVAAWMGRDSYRPVMAGEPAPAFTAATLDGQQRSLDDYRGKVVLLNIWATWCPPCREEMPSMEALSQTLVDTDFQIVAVSVDASTVGGLGWGGNIGGDVDAFVEEFDLTFDILRDPAGAIARSYQVTGLPESFLIGRNGLIYRKVPGGTDWNDARYVEQIRRLLDS